MLYKGNLFLTSNTRISYLVYLVSFIMLTIVVFLLNTMDLNKIKFYIANFLPMVEFYSTTHNLLSVYDTLYTPFNYPIIDEEAFVEIKAQMLESAKDKTTAEIYRHLDDILEEQLRLHYGENLEDKDFFLRILSAKINEFVRNNEFDANTVYWPYYNEKTEAGMQLQTELEFYKKMDDICFTTNDRIYKNNHFADLMKNSPEYIFDRGIGNNNFIYIVELVKDLTLYSAFKNLSIVEIINSYLNGYSSWYQNLVGHYLIDIRHFKNFGLEIIYLAIVFAVFMRNTIKAKYHTHLWSSTYRTNRTSGWAIFFFIIFFYNFQQLYYILLKTHDIIFYSNAYLYFYETIIIDYYSSFIKGLLLVLLLVNFLISFNYIRYDFFEEWEYPILLLFSLFGLFCLVSSFNFLLFFICLEFIAITSYFLTALKRYDPLGSEAGIKYFIQGAMASFFLSFGIALIYGFFGSLSFVDIKYEVLNMYYDYQFDPYSNYINVVLIAGIVSLAITFLFKISSAPFHFWTPDVYEGTPLIITSFFAIVVKLGVFTSFLRIFYYLFKHFSEFIQPVLIIGAVCSMLIGSIGGIYQRKVKRLFAYSTITHVGYILMGLSTFTYMGLKAALVYIVIYCFTMFGIFAYIALGRNFFSWERVVYINDLRVFGIHRYNIYYTASLVVLVFSLAGIPPLAGFYAKWYVFEAVMSTDLWVLAFVGIFSSVVSCYYYLHLIKVMIFEEVEWALVIFYVHEMDQFILSSATVFSIAFPVFGSYFMTFIDDLTFNLLSPFEVSTFENRLDYYYLNWSEFMQLHKTFSPFEKSIYEGFLDFMIDSEIAMEAPFEAGLNIRDTVTKEFSYRSLKGQL